MPKVRTMTTEQYRAHIQHRIRVAAHIEVGLLEARGIVELQAEPVLTQQLRYWSTYLECWRKELERVDRNAKKTYSRTYVY